MARTILITGANGGLGTAVVKKFLAEKYQVIAADHGATHLGFAREDPNFRFQSVHLDNEEEVKAFVDEAIVRSPAIDGTLLLAGGFAMGDIGTTDGAALKKMYTLNFETAYYVARPVFEHMLTKGYGRIVLVGSRPALEAKDGRSMVAYALSKTLLFKLAELMNASAGGKNVVVSVIVPSVIDTPANRQSMPDARTSDWVRPEQIADLLEFICSEKGMPLREPVYKVYNNA